MASCCRSEKREDSGIIAGVGVSRVRTLWNAGAEITQNKERE